MVFDVKNNLAAVKFDDYQVGIVERNGNIQMKLGRCRRIKFMPDDIAVVTDNDNRTFYIDIKTTRLYKEKPEVLKYGRIVILKVGGLYYSRTKHVYKSHSGMTDFDCNYKFKYIDSVDTFMHRDCVCILANDENEYYWFCGELADKSIVVTDENGNYYHIMDGKEKQYIACEHPKNQTENFDIAVQRLKTEAEARSAKMRENLQQEKERKQQERLASIQQAVPFQSGLKWGLKLGDRIIVPPVYRNIQTPVGNYCAVEANPQQWGVIMLDGKMVIEARYTDIIINNNGTARLTIFPGMTKTVKL